jgi:membrane-bound serine protease (ClpP class)
VCLVLYFGARSMIGMADWIDAALVVAGIVLLLTEIFVIPGFGIVGAAGIVCIVAGVLMSLTFTGFTLPQYSWEYERLHEAAFTVSLTAVLLVAFVFITWRLLPRTPIYGHLVMGEEQLAAKGYTVQGEEARAAIGLRGIATSLVRPAGRGRFGDKTLQVVSLGEYIEPGTPIVIVEVDGNRYVVDRIRENA